VTVGGVSDSGLRGRSGSSRKVKCLSRIVHFVDGCSTFHPHALVLFFFSQCPFWQNKQKQTDRVVIIKRWESNPRPRWGWLTRVGRAPRLKASANHLQPLRDAPWEEKKAERRDWREEWECVRRLERRGMRSRTLWFTDLPSSFAAHWLPPLWLRWLVGSECHCFSSVDCGICVCVCVCAMS